jgi:hypothetical protein
MFDLIIFRSLTQGESKDGKLLIETAILMDVFFWVHVVFFMFGVAARILPSNVWFTFSMRMHPTKMNLKN